MKTAQLVASSVKGLNTQNLRGATPTISTATGNIQLLGTIQRPRSVPIAASPIASKQLTARALVTPQRNIANAATTMKIATPITGNVYFNWILPKIEIVDG